MYYNNYKLTTILIKNDRILNNNFENLAIDSSFDFQNSYNSEYFFKNTDFYITYSRINNPTLNFLKKKLNKFNKSNNCLIFSSGMSSIFNTLICLIKPFDNFLSFKNLFNSTLNLFIIIFYKFNINVIFFNSDDNFLFKIKIINYNFKFLYIENPDNPLLNILSLQNKLYFTNKNKIYFVLDNTFNLFLNSMLYKIDVIIYSSTKFLDGKGRILGGVTFTNNAFIFKLIFIYNKLFGSIISCFNAWILLKSMKTIILRMKRKILNSFKLLNLIKFNNYLLNLYFPGFNKKKDYYRFIVQQILPSPLISFELSGLNDEIKRLISWRFLNNIKLIRLSANLGDINTIINISSITTHININFIEKKNLNIGESLIRLSIGLEDIYDITLQINRIMNLLVYK